MHTTRWRQRDFAIVLLFLPNFNGYFHCGTSARGQTADRSQADPEAESAHLAFPTQDNGSRAEKFMLVRGGGSESQPCHNWTGMEYPTAPDATASGWVARTRTEFGERCRSFERNLRFNGALRGGVGCDACADAAPG
jgi:hypothetical protein